MDYDRQFKTAEEQDHAISKQFKLSIRALRGIGQKQVEYGPQLSKLNDEKFSCTKPDVPFSSMITTDSHAQLKHAETEKKATTGQKLTKKEKKLIRNEKKFEADKKKKQAQIDKDKNKKKNSQKYQRPVVTYERKTSFHA